MKNKQTPDSFFSGGSVLGMIGLCGKPGAGKGIESLRLIIAELLDRDSQRIIVTNCALHLDKITAFLAERGRDDINVYERVYILSWEDTPKFYLRRSLNFLGEETRPDPKMPPQVDFASFPDTPCLYVLDECHEFFNARSWQRVSNDTAVLAYVSKHRHLGDGIIWISQTVASVDKQFRERSQEYRITRNWAKERFGKFSKGTGFLVTSYLAPPTPSEKPQWSEERKPLPDFLACYSTSLYNKTADVGKVVKGLNIKKWIFILIPVAALLFFGISSLGRLVRAKVDPKEDQVFAPSTNSVSAPAAPSPSVTSSPEAEKVLVFTPPNRWNPLNTPLVSRVPKSELQQTILAPVIISPHPIPFESSGYFGGKFHLGSDGKRYHVGDYWQGLQITGIYPKAIVTGNVTHPVTDPSNNSKPNPKVSIIPPVSESTISP